MRLRTGSLDAIPKIKDFLRSHPGQSFSGSQIARRLGKNQHHINGALIHLTHNCVGWIKKTDSQTTRNHPRYKWEAEEDDQE